jgi:energy-coupling factor transporter ATP-binding protein EcfA2
MRGVRSRLVVPARGLSSDEVLADILDATAGRTTVLVTHQSAGLASADEIVVLDRGRVVDRGRAAPAPGPRPAPEPALLGHDHGKILPEH